jgi:hypothetical protein
MTILRLRHPLLASVPFVTLAFGTAELEAQTPPTTGAGVVARASAVPADRIQLTTDQVRAIIAAQHPDIATGASEDNILTIVIASNGDFVLSGSVKGVILTATVVDRGAVVPGSPAPRAATVVVIPGGRPSSGDTLRLPGITGIERSLIKDLYTTTYAAGEVSPAAVSVRVVTLVGTAASLSKPKQ